MCLYLNSETCLVFTLFRSFSRIVLVFMQMVQQGDHLKIPHDPKYGLLLKQELRCHKCPDSFRTMPQLKTHLKIHFGAEMESVSATQA
ncbi:hypothetical protein AHF37_09839 [Paragonimus kellicotti]|nr:hypothetical protein AHF37_09838 [Paragonimus kellicotti]KAF6772705.1 hypothetical protein AHF37_09839 [Paragonimus kellicotti]